MYFISIVPLGKILLMYNYVNIWFIKCDTMMSQWIMVAFGLDISKMSIKAASIVFYHAYMTRECS